MTIGSRVKLSALGRCVFSVACVGMAQSGVVTGMRERTYRPAFATMNVTMLVLLVRRDGERQERGSNGEWWEEVK